MNCLDTSRPPCEKIWERFHLIGIVLVTALASVYPALAVAQSASPSLQGAVTIEGTVRDSAGKPAGDASVVLQRSDHSIILENKTKADGAFVFSGLVAGVYIVRAEKPDCGKAVPEAISLSAGGEKRIDLILKLAEATGAGSSGTSSAGKTAPGSMEFADQPNFTVAGITDWNNVGLHASGTDARTSEALAKETLALKSPIPGESLADAPEEILTSERAIATEKKLRAALAQAPRSFGANHQLGEFYCHSKRYAEAIPLLTTASQIDPANFSNAYELALAYVGNGELDRAREQGRKMSSNANSEAHRLAGDLEERLGDPLAAVREYEQATKLDASEQNYFQWGTELLVHKAAQPAAEVFTKGFSAHPDSARLLTGLGAAVFASGAYEQAARRLCEASDLRPADPAPYLLLGKMEKAAPEALPCNEEKLERFVAQQPENALANYYFALSLWKRTKGSDNPARLALAKVHLEKAVKIDPKLGEAYLQLGILQAESGDFAGAVGAYQKAIEVNPQLGEAHYRLGLAYKRIGDEAKAQKEMRTYKQIEMTEADALEREQRELRQFLIILKDQPAGSAPH